MAFNKVQIKFKEYKKLPIRDFSNLEINKLDGHDNQTFFMGHPDCQFKDCEILEKDKLPATWREVYNVKLNIADEFVPGDSVGILCPNKDEYAEKMLRILGLENACYEIIKKNAFHFKGALFDFFKYFYDFTCLPKKATLMKLSKGNKDLEYLSSREGSSDYFGMIKNWNNILDIIYTFGCKPSLHDLVSSCEILKPRYYSLTNKVGANFEILVGIISKEVELVDSEGSTSHETRYGHVSQYILNPNGRIKICLRESKLIRLNDSKKVLLICTGTGVAPFLSFLKNKTQGQKFWVIYGFRNEEDDLFIGEYEDTLVDRVLSSKGQYVTGFIMSNIKKIKEYASHDCSIFVCGRMDMQKEVYRIFNSELENVVNEKRLFFDNWQ